jgi:galactokinase
MYTIRSHLTQTITGSNYFKCGYKGVLDELDLQNGVTSLKIAVDGISLVLTHLLGIVPAGSGLSSSSSFVCTSALATLMGNGRGTPILHLHLTPQS